MDTIAQSNQRNFFNRYYHDTMDRWLKFIIAPGKTVLNLSLARTLNSQARFDYVVMDHLIGHMNDVQQGFEALHKVTDEHSRIVITYHNYLWEGALKLAEFLHLKKTQPTQNWLARQDIINILSLAHFEVVKQGSLILIPIYIPLISNFANRYLARLPLLKQLCLIEYLVARERPRSYSDKEYSVSVIIPARNEAGNIEAAVTRLPNLGTKTEIIFVEGGSKDETKAAIARVMEKYKDSKTIISLDQGTGVGKGDAVRRGFAAATGDIVMILDADLTVPPEDLPKFYQAIRNRTGEFVMGTRLVYPMEQGAMRFLNILGNKFFSAAFSWLLDQPLKDTLCGTKVMFRADYEELARNRNYFGDFDPFGDFDLIFGAAKLNLKILEIPIRYQARTYGTTNISRFRHGWLLLKMTIFAARKMKFI
ncbi:MAG: glycosyltransferase family 2 protein [bacterium]|nr:glycosyltransferase family 2 protein [bacterium]